MREPPGALDGARSVSRARGRGKKLDGMIEAGHNVLIYGTGQIKNEATFFIVFIIILFTVLVHRVGRDEAALLNLTLRESCAGNIAPTSLFYCNTLRSETTT